MKKKAIALLTCMALIISLFGVTGFAEEQLSDVEKVQQMIYQLPEPEEITDENANDVITQLQAIDEIKWQFTDEENMSLDTYKYDAAAFVLTAPEGWAGLWLTKIYDETAVTTPDPTFSFVDGSGMEANLVANNVAATSVDVDANGYGRFVYIPEGTYEAVETVEGDWDVSMTVNGHADSDMEHYFQSGSIYSLAFENTYSALDVYIGEQGINYGELNITKGYNLSEDSEVMGTLEVTVDNVGLSDAYMTTFTNSDLLSVTLKEGENPVYGGQKATYTVALNKEGLTETTEETITFRQANAEDMEVNTYELQISINMIEPECLGVVHEPLTEVPEGLEFTDVDQLKAVLIAPMVAAGYATDGITCYDSFEAYKIYDRTVSAENLGLTTGEIQVTFAYPEDTNAEDYNFMVSHLCGDGTIETPEVTEGSDGIEVTLNGLSPTALGWKLASPTDGLTPNEDGTYKDDDGNIYLPFDDNDDGEIDRVVPVTPESDGTYKDEDGNVYIPVDTDGDGDVDVFVPVEKEDDGTYKDEDGNIYIPVDTDGDGDVDVFVPVEKEDDGTYKDEDGNVYIPVDTDGDGDVDEFVPVEKEDDGTYKDEDGNVYIPVDTDGDGDVDEFVPVTPQNDGTYKDEDGNTYIPVDTDGDGDVDEFVPVTPQNDGTYKDEDGNTYIPVDTDGDGDVDEFVPVTPQNDGTYKDEEGNTYIPVDTDGDGDADGFVPSPSNGTGDGDGNGDGTGNGAGAGTGNGAGDGTGNGAGAGTGDGNGAGTGDGTGNQAADNGSTPEADEDDAPDTGDRTPLLSWLLVVAVAAVAAGAVRLRKDS